MIEIILFFIFTVVQNIQLFFSNLIFQNNLSDFPHKWYFSFPVACLTLVGCGFFPCCLDYGIQPCGRRKRGDGVTRPAYHPRSQSQWCRRFKKEETKKQSGDQGLLPLRGNSNPLSQVMIFICYFLLPCTYRITYGIYNVNDQGHRYARHRPFVFIHAIND